MSRESPSTLIPACIEVSCGDISIDAIFDTLSTSLVTDSSSFQQVADFNVEGELEDIDQSASDEVAAREPKSCRQASVQSLLLPSEAGTRRACLGV